MNRMPRLLVCVACLLPVAACGPARPRPNVVPPAGVAEDDSPPDPEAEGRIAETVLKRGGTVQRDEAAPGKPIVEIDFQEFKLTSDEMKEAGGSFAAADARLTEATDSCLKELAGLKRLRTLRLGSQWTEKVRVTSPGGQQFTGFTIRGGIRMTDEGLKEMAGLKNLQVLELHMESPTWKPGKPNTVTAEGLKGLAELRDLRELHLSGCGYAENAAFWRELSRLTGLQLLDVPDGSWKGLAVLKQVRNLGIGGPTVEEIQELAGMDGLVGLRIAGCSNPSEEGMEELGKLNRLQMLDLSDGQFAFQDLEYLIGKGGLPGLRRLILDGASVTDAGLERVARLKGLQKVSLHGLRGDKVTADGVARLRKALPGCEIIYP